MWIAAMITHEPLLTSLKVSLIAAATAGLTIVTTAPVLILKRLHASQVATIVVVVFASASTLLALLSTGHSQSPYIALWLIISLFSAISGYKSALPVILLILGYGALTLGDYNEPAKWLGFSLSFIVPVVVSYIAWNHRQQTQDGSNQAVSTLAQELNQESNKSDIIVNAIADGVLVITQNGIVDMINPAAQSIIGWNKDDALKLDYRSVLRILNADNSPLDSALDPIQQCLKTNQPVITDRFSLQTSSGKSLLASILVSPLGSSSNGVIVVLRDTTAQHAEEREQAEFISTASHEMRTPVAAIEGYIGLALNPSTAVIDEKARAYLSKAQESASHLGRLFQDLLDVSKVEDGRLKSTPTMADLTGFVRTVLEDFKAAAAQKNLVFSFLPDTSSNGASVAPIYYANVDLDHLREIISNLVGNAIKYTKEGKVSVDVTGTDDRIYIKTTDSGIGIPAEDIPHLFQKFYRVDNTDTREIGGTGLGLYLSRRLVESMDGKLELESEYGKGSTFTINLPRVSREDALNVLQSVTAKQPQTETKL
jgi:PAS domain S-box-containing protein